MTEFHVPMSLRAVAFHDESVTKRSASQPTSTSTNLFCIQITTLSVNIKHSTTIYFSSRLDKKVGFEQDLVILQEFLIPGVL